MTLLENNNTFREYMGYSKAYTRNGFICYYLKGGRIAKKDVPTDIIKHLPTDRELTFFSIEERRSNIFFICSFDILKLSQPLFLNISNLGNRDLNIYLKIFLFFILDFKLI